MSDYDRNSRIPGAPNPRLTARGWSSGSWVAGIVVAILVIVAVGYTFRDRWMGNGMIENRAATTDTATPTTPAPSPSATPAAKP